MLSVSRRVVLAACSRYFEAMFSGGLRESLDSDVNFRDSIHPEVLLPLAVLFLFTGPSQQFLGVLLGQVLLV